MTVTSSSSRRQLLSGAAKGALAAAGLATLARRSDAGEEPAGVAPAPSALTQFGFTKLLVADLEKSAAFYTAVCGLVESTRIEAEIAGRRIVEILYQPTAPGAATLVLLHYADAVKPSAEEVILGFTTTDVRAFVARALAAGGSLLQEPHTLADMKIDVAFVKDPEGHLIEVVQPLA